MITGPDRHAAIPAQAEWDADQDKWEVAVRDASGTKHGAARLFRSDGTVYMTFEYAAGVRQGAFTIFHSDGTLAREGRFEQGELDGPVNAFTAPGDAYEPLRGCCVPENAASLRAQYQRGDLLFERFFDQAGRALLSDGRLLPDRPATVPAQAEYDESEDRWAVGPGPSEPEGLWRFFDLEGRLTEEARFRGGRRIFCRLFQSDGSFVHETHFDDRGQRSGPHRRRFGVDPSPYADTRIVEEEGQYTDDRPTGTWRFRDAHGEVIRAVDRGRPFPVDGLSHPVFSERQRDLDGWRAYALALAAEGLMGEAFCAAARAVAACGKIDPLVTFAEQHGVALRPEIAVDLADSAQQSEVDAVPHLVSALVCGAEPASVLRALATAQRDVPWAGHDFVEAAIAFAPDRPMAFLSRALLRIELGDLEGALSDADRVAGASAESASFVRDYARVLLPRWTFWPQGAAGEERVEGLPDAPAQSLAAIRHALSVYATRLLRLREAVLERLPQRQDAPWLPPALSQLLPDGPVALERREATIIDTTDEGDEEVVVQVDETLDTTGAGLPALLRAARGQWAALTWLCWASGQTEVAMPETLRPPEDFAAAAGRAITRFFRVQDVLTTGGLRSHTAGIPSFTWESMDVDTMPRPFVQLALEEYHELRALFLWLLSTENLSPFQSDIREID